MARYLVGITPATGVLLLQLLTFWNNYNDWELRCWLLPNLPNVCGVVGQVITDKFVVLCVDMSLLEEECLVIWEGL